MQLRAFMDVLERLAPQALAEEWDNPGLLIEPENTEITRVLVALDCTVEVAEEAKDLGAQLVLVHHPLFFKPVRHIYHSEPETAAAYKLVRHGIGLFAAHTNLDSALMGVNDALADVMGLKNICGLSSPCLPLSKETQDIGRIGTLQTPMPLSQLAFEAQQKLHTAVRIGGVTDKIVSRLAVVGGNGSSMLKEVKDSGADALLTGEIKHDQVLAARVYGLGIIEAGHYETECVVLNPWIDGLQHALEEIQYNVDFVRAKNDYSPLIAPGLA